MQGRTSVLGWGQRGVGCTLDPLLPRPRPQVDKILLEVAGETLSQMAAAPRQQKQASRAAQLECGVLGIWHSLLPFAFCAAPFFAAAPPFLHTAW